MATYEYRAKQGPGQDSVTGVLEAESRLVALDKLSQQGYFPLSVEEIIAASKKSRWTFRNPVPRKDLSLFTRQLADLLESEVPLLKALRLTERQTTNPALLQVLREILEQVKGGKSFSQALQDYPSLFSSLYVSLIYAGEVGGNLSLTLSRLADFIEQEEEFKSRLTAALAYPLLIAVIGLGSIVFLMAFAVPRLASMFTDLGQRMPWITRVLTHISSGLVDYGVWLILLLPMGWFLFRQGGPLTTLKVKISNALIRIPIWGPVIQKSVIARFARTLAILLSGGVPITESLRVVSDVLDHPALKDRILAVASEVEQGKSLSESLKKVSDFPMFICHMIAVGEEVNTLEKSLNKVAATYERETDRAMKLATSLLEPMMILVMGSVVGVIVIAMLLPIFQVSAFVK